MNENKATYENKANFGEQLSIYLHTIVHELRNPLVSIQGFSSLLADNFSNNLPIEATKYLERIISNSTQLESLLTDITKLAKVSINETDFEKISIHEIILAALDSFGIETDHKDVEIKIHPIFPEIYCDVKTMIQVYSNLITNAIKYARDGHKLKLEFGYSDDELFYKFFVKDNGVGISAKDNNKVFRLFGRLHNKSNVNGTGLGLSIVKRIIEGHGGEVWLVSKRNTGTSIYFTLPKMSPF